MSYRPTQILLADDDSDDCGLFEEALDELEFPVGLSIVHNGEQLMQRLSESVVLPNLLFLDLNIPRKNGMECLWEISQQPRLELLPVIIYSTSFEQRIVNQLYERGAYNYIRKPADFTQLKAVIKQVIEFSNEYPGKRPAKEQFVIQPQ